MEHAPSCFFSALFSSSEATSFVCASRSSVAKHLASDEFKIYKCEELLARCEHSVEHAPSCFCNALFSSSEATSFVCASRSFLSTLTFKRWKEVG